MYEYELDDDGLGDEMNRFNLLYGALHGLMALVLNHSIATLLSSNQMRLAQTARYVQEYWMFFAGCALLFGVAYLLFYNTSFNFYSFLGDVTSFRYRTVVAMLGVVVACLFEKLVGRALFGASEHKLLLFVAFFLTDRVLMIPVLSEALLWVAEHIFAIAIVIAILFFFFRI